MNTVKESQMSKIKVIGKFLLLGAGLVVIGLAIVPAMLLKRD